MSLRTTHYNLYGVAEQGGAHGAGTAFKLSPVSGGKWKFSTLDGFQGTPHAGFPYGGLISDAASNLYGTTYFGGANGLGSVFKLTKSNGKFTESVLYSFKAEPDGNSPTSTLVFDAHGNLYGTTSAGGDANGDGTIFKLTPTSGASGRRPWSIVSKTIRTVLNRTTVWYSTRKAIFTVRPRLVGLAAALSLSSHLDSISAFAVSF